MTPDEAYFHKILLLTGFPDRYAPWIQRMLEEAETLDGPLLELAWAGSDPKSILSALNHAFPEGSADMRRVADLVRADLKLRMDVGELDMPGCMKTMKRIALASDWETEEPWQTMALLSDLCDDALDGLISMNCVEAGFRNFMENGAPMTSPYPLPPPRKKASGWLCRLWRRLRGKSKV